MLKRSGMDLNESEFGKKLLDKPPSDPFVEMLGYPDTVKRSPDDTS